MTSRSPYRSLAPAEKLLERTASFRSRTTRNCPFARTPVRMALIEPVPAGICFSAVPRREFLRSITRRSGPRMVKILCSEDLLRSRTTRVRPFSDHTRMSSTVAASATSGSASRIDASKKRGPNMLKLDSQARMHYVGSVYESGWKNQVFLVQYYRDT